MTPYLRTLAILLIIAASLPTAIANHADPTASPTDATAGTTTTYTISLTAWGGWPSDGVFSVTFPAGYNLTAATAGALTGCLGGANGGLALAPGYPTANEVRLARDGTGGACGPESILTVTIGGVGNPTAAGTTGTFAVATMDGLSEPIDVGTAPGAAITAGPPSQIQAVTTANNIVADGASLARVEVTLRDQYANPVAGATVRVTDAGGLAPLTGASAATNAAGAATFEAASTTATTYTITFANLTAGNDAAAVTFVAGPPAQLASVLTGNGALANGLSELRVNITVQDAQGNPVQGATVRVTDDAGLAALTDATNTTDAEGLTSFTATSVQGGLFSVVFTEDTVGTLTVNLTFTALPVGGGGGGAPALSSGFMTWAFTDYLSPTRPDRTWGLTHPLHAANIQTDLPAQLMVQFRDPAGFPALPQTHEATFYGIDLKIESVAPVTGHIDIRIDAASAEEWPRDRLVLMHHHDGTWNEIPLQILSDDDGLIVRFAVPEEFSPFVIALRAPEPEPAAEPQGDPAPGTDDADTRIEPDAAEGQEPRASPQESPAPAFLVLVLAALAMAAIRRRR